MSSAEIYLGSGPVLTLAAYSLWTTGAVFHPKGKALKAKPGNQILSQGQNNSIYDTGLASGEDVVRFLSSVKSRSDIIYLKKLDPSAHHIHRWLPGGLKI